MAEELSLEEKQEQDGRGKGRHKRKTSQQPPDRTFCNFQASESINWPNLWRPMDIEALKSWNSQSGKAGTVDKKQENNDMVSNLCLGYVLSFLFFLPLDSTPLFLLGLSPWRKKRLNLLFFHSSCFGCSTTELFTSSELRHPSIDVS